MKTKNNTKTLAQLREVSKITSAKQIENNKLIWKE